jgi:predicted O-methyltransferase YrrM
MVKAHGYELREIRANTHPLRFARQFGDAHNALPPNFARYIGSPEQFALAQAYAWNSEPSASEFLGEIAFYKRAQTIVELGCFVGWTSAHLALGLKAADCNGKLWCLDYDASFLEAARTNLTRLGLANSVEFVQGLSLDPIVLGTMPTAIDLLFIDTSHEYKDTLAELTAYLPRLAPGGLIALHDSISQDGVRRAIFDRWPEFETLTFATEFGNGITVLRSPAHKADPV